MTITHTKAMVAAPLTALEGEMLVALRDAREAIAGLEIDALGTGGDDDVSWPLRDELLSRIGTVIAKAESGELRAEFRAWRVGDAVLWPNGVEGKVMAIDDSDGTMMDHCGGWHDADDCDLIEGAVS